jgi:hypothetical protein
MAILTTGVTSTPWHHSLRLYVSPSPAMETPAIETCLAARIHNTSSRFLTPCDVFAASCGGHCSESAVLLDQ